MPLASEARSPRARYCGEQCGKQWGEQSTEPCSVTSDGKSGGKDNNGSIQNRGRRSRALVLVLL